MNRPFLTRERILILLLLFIALAVYRVWVQPDDGREESRRLTVTAANVSWEAALARTPQERERGLGYRDSLCRGCGLLFVFDEPGIHRFWMKGMRFPIDILFLSGSTVVSVERNVAPDDPRILSPPVPVTTVLEVNASEASLVSPGMEVSGLSL